MKEAVKLEAIKVTKSFGGIHALKGVDFELRKGEIHALIGANGAGKSTLIKIISGNFALDGGKILIDGKEVRLDSPESAKNHGIAAVYQELTQVNYLSVAENMFLGNIPYDPKNKIKFIQWDYVYQKANEILKELNCDLGARNSVKDLSVAQKQIVEIAKALVQEAQILIFDEPTASLTNREMTILFTTIKNLAEGGRSIIYISHRLEELQLIADRVTVFKDGMNVGTFMMKETAKEKLVKVMIGENLKHQEKVSNITEEKLLEVKGLTRKPYFADINFSLCKGEVLGITGLVGAGRSETVRAIFGLDKLQSGEIYINSQKVKIKSPQDAKKIGIGFITENRKEEGLVLIHDLKNNICITILDKLKKLLWLDRTKENDLCNKIIKKLEIKVDGLNQKVKNLSGGNQQKVVIAKWLATDPKILILDEPTKGIDVGVKGQIYSILNQLVDQGIGVLIITSEISEILEICDRVLVMSGGKIINEIQKNEMNQEILLNSITSTKC
jgi:ABC-type sugar transport system ATPase subunit